jgi:hypothetical protein
MLPLKIKLLEQGVLPLLLNLAGLVVDPELGGWTSLGLIKDRLW